ncbi:MAG: MipA/OmpV family protein [Massilia sp.]
MLTASLLAALCMPAHAQVAPDTPPEPGDRPQTVANGYLPLWELGLIGGAAFTPAYPGSSGRSSRVLALPYFVYRGKVLRTDAGGLGARLITSDRIELDAGVSLSLPARSDKNSARAGMPDLGTLLEAGPRLKIKLLQIDPTTRLRLELPLRAVLSTNSGVKHRGFTFEPRIGLGTRFVEQRTSVDASFGAVFGDSGLNRYLYDVSPQYALPSRPAYHARAGLTLLRAGLSASHNYTPDVRLFGFLRYESYAAATNRDSPLLTAANGVGAGFGIAWTFRRSSTMSPTPTMTATSQ